MDQCFCGAGIFTRWREGDASKIAGCFSVVSRGWGGLGEVEAARAEHSF